MTKRLTDPELIRELEPVVEAGLNQHFAATRNWTPHDYVPWSDGPTSARWVATIGISSESRLSEVARIAMVTNLLTEDNLPSYHRAIAEYFTLDDAWGTGSTGGPWRRTGTASRCATTWSSPGRWTRWRLERPGLLQVTAGFSPGQQGQGAIRPESFLDALVYVTFQELATRVSHRNTGRACEEPVADALLKRMAFDENLHMIFYRGVGAAASIWRPTRPCTSICRILVNFQMPGFSIPNFRRNAVKMAVGGIYDMRQHLDEVVLPVLRKWRIFERDDFSGVGQRNATSSPTSSRKRRSRRRSSRSPRPATWNAEPRGRTGVGQGPGS